MKKFQINTQSLRKLDQQVVSAAAGNQDPTIPMSVRNCHVVGTALSGPRDPYTFRSCQGVGV